MTKKLFRKIVPLGVEGVKGQLYHGYTTSNKILHLTYDGELWYVIEVDSDCITRYRPVTIDKLKFALAFGKNK